MENVIGMVKGVRLMLQEIELWNRTNGVRNEDDTHLKAGRMEPVGSNQRVQMRRPRILLHSVIWKLELGAIRNFQDDTMRQDKVLDKKNEHKRIREFVGFKKSFKRKVAA